MKTAVLEKYAWHPWVFAIYYVVFPYIINIQHLPIQSIVKPLFIILLGTSIFFLLLLLIFKKTDLAAIFTSITLILFFSYPPVFSIIQVIALLTGSNEGIFEKTLQISKIWIFIPLLIIILGGITIPKKDPKFTRLLKIALNAASLLLLVINCCYAIIKINDLRSTRTFEKNWKTTIKEVTDQKIKLIQPQRDIYLIVLDAYGSRQVLQELYQFDNSHFENELIKLGFQIIPNGRTNYNQTRTSFSSMLNMQYLDEISSAVGGQTTDAHPLINMIQNNRVSALLHSAGYTIINFPSGYEYTEDIQADYQIKGEVYLDNFAQTLIWNSAAYPFLHRKLYDWHRENITSAIDGLADLSAYPSPKFVIAHIFAPHPPFVFDKDGNELIPNYQFTAIDADTLRNNTSTEYYKAQYTEQLEYISNSILQTIQDILDDSTTQPIIILCGDHGPAMTVSLTNVYGTEQYERVHILDALYLPGVAADQVLADHTPVNTFRIILNNYFGEDLPLLENRTYVSSYDTPYHFVEIPGSNGDQ